MSHLRPDLKADERLYQSIAIEPRGLASVVTPIAPPARRWNGRGLMARLHTWRANRRARQNLALLDARTLRDLGIAPEMVHYERAQPAWRPLRDPRF